MEKRGKEGKLVQYTVAMSACRPEGEGWKTTNRIEIMPCVIYGRSKDEVLEIGMRMCKKRWPVEDGWGTHLVAPALTSSLKARLRETSKEAMY